jgi:putative aldouronate transport system substrate-binding protein
MWLSITDEESRAKFGKSAGELKSVNEVYGPKLILSKYYNEVFYMEDRAIVRLEDLYYKWMKLYVKSTVTYPIDCVFTKEELDEIDRYKQIFEGTVSEQEGLWLKDGGPGDEEWNNYLNMLDKNCGMNELLKIYQQAYDRYKQAQ